VRGINEVQTVSSHEVGEEKEGLEDSVLHMTQ
jgi:hypothetical protein